MASIILLLFVPASLQLLRGPTVTYLLGTWVGIFGVLSNRPSDSCVVALDSWEVALDSCVVVHRPWHLLLVIGPMQPALPFLSPLRSLPAAPFSLA